MATDQQLQVCEQPKGLRQVEFTNTETSHPATLPGTGKDGESPKGLGRDGNKPLMRNRTANEVPSPDRYNPGNTFMRRAIRGGHGHGPELREIRARRNGSLVKAGKQLTRKLSHERLLRSLRSAWWVYYLTDEGKTVYITAIPLPKKNAMGHCRAAQRYYRGRHVIQITETPPNDKLSDGSANNQ